MAEGQCMTSSSHVVGAFSICWERILNPTTLYIGKGNSQRKFRIIIRIWIKYVIIVNCKATLRTTVSGLLDTLLTGSSKRSQNHNRKFNSDKYATRHGKSCKCYQI